jgi:hypothetical protein
MWEKRTKAGTTHFFEFQDSKETCYSVVHNTREENAPKVAKLVKNVVVNPNYFLTRTSRTCRSEQGEGTRGQSVTHYMVKEVDGLDVFGRPEGVAFIFVRTGSLQRLCRPLPARHQYQS